MAGEEGDTPSPRSTAVSVAAVQTSGLKDNLEKFGNVIKSISGKKSGISLLPSTRKENVKCRL